MRNDPLRNIVVILVGTKYPGNIGSVARAMHNMRLKSLRLAAPECEINDESIRMARSGSCILERARSYPSLRRALNGIRLAIATSGKIGGHRDKVSTPRSLAPQILAKAQDQKVGIVFGPEDTGLIDDDLILCQRLLRIPTHAQARSLNLAQALMVVAYEIFLASFEREPARTPRFATVTEVESMYAHLEEALREIGFLQAQNARHMMFALRGLFGRAGLEEADVAMLRGIARQIRWYARTKRQGDKS